MYLRIDMPCNSLISDVQIESIYQDDTLIKRNNVASQCDGNDCKKSLIDIYDKDDNWMLQKAIERSYFRNKVLFSDDSRIDKVVKHEYFILKDEFQGKKIISKIHPKEMDIYRTCGFKEIQLDAAWDGLVVWKKMFFVFKTKQDENLIKIAIQRYLREAKGMSLDEIDKAIKNDPFSISPHHLKDNSNPNNDFKLWVYNNCRGIGLAKMYKEVA